MSRTDRSLRLWILVAFLAGALLAACAGSPTAPAPAPSATRLRIDSLGLRVHTLPMGWVETLDAHPLVDPYVPDTLVVIEAR